MLAHITPSREVTGGSWYHDERLDQDLIEVCQQAAYRIIEQSRFANLEQVHLFIRQKQLLTVDLGPEEMQQVLSSLVYDGKVCSPCVGLQPFFRPRSGGGAADRRQQRCGVLSGRENAGTDESVPRYPVCDMPRVRGVHG